MLSYVQYQSSYGAVKIKLILQKSTLITLALVILLILLTIAFLWKDVFYNDDVAALNHSLELSYFGTTTTFDGPLHINQELKDVSVTPSVVSWCYPPGVSTLINITYHIFGFKITNVNIIFLILQMLAVILSFFTFRKILNNFAAFVLSLFVLAFLAKIAFLPDYLLLPFLILVFTIIFYSHHQFTGKPKPIILISLGVLVGLIAYIKHNTGILLFVALSSYIFFSALQFDVKDEQKSRTNSILVWTVILIHLVFGLVFLFQMMSVITSLYYILPFALFFLFLIYYMFYKNKNVYLNTEVFLRNLAFFAAPFVIIVVAWFVWFGTTVGFSRYFDSLYGMYSGFTGIWNVGVFDLFTRNFDYQGFSSFSAIAGTIYSLFYACLIFVPFITAIISAATMVFQMVRHNLGKIKQYLGICILGVMGIFFLYPMESGHNIATRIFPFVFILFFFITQVKLFTKRNALILFTILLIFVSPLIISDISDSISVARGDYVRISEKVDVKVPGELAREINRATDMIDTTTEGKRYYVIDSYSALYIYYYLTDVDQKNYFIEMRPGIIDKEVAAEITDTIADYQYLVVNKKQYDMFIDGTSYNPDLDDLFNYIRDNYIIKNTFIKNLEHDDEQFMNFYIMKVNHEEN